MCGRFFPLERLILRVHLGEINFVSLQTSYEILMNRTRFWIEQQHKQTLQVTQRPN